jgi:L-malate glycosyltransferase
VTILPLDSLCSTTALRHLFWLRRYVKTNNVDLIHTFFPASDILGALVARSSFRPVISSRRDMGILGSHKHRLAYRIVNRMFTKVQAVSEGVRQHCIEVDHFSPAKVVTIRNGIDLTVVDSSPTLNLRAALGIPAGVPLVVTVANIRPVKGLDVFIRAAAVVRQHIPDCAFLIVGYHQEEACVRELFQLVRHFGLKDCVFMPGLRDDTISILKNSDAFCLPSRSEGLSNALLEAMACGLPCVATSVGGNPEVLSDGIDGYLVAAERPDLLASALMKVLRNNELKSQIAKAARHTVETRFTAAAMADGFAHLYHEILDASTFSACGPVTASRSQFPEAL